MWKIEPRVWNAKEVGTSLEGAVYVGRPSPFGNPFRVGRDVATKAEAISKFRTYLLGNPCLIEKVKHELRGKDLICWCYPKDCHANVLIDVANEE